MPDGMRDKLRVEADKNGRSMNSEIIARLEASFGPTPPYAGIGEVADAMRAQGVFNHIPPLDFGDDVMVSVARYWEELSRQAGTEHMRRLKEQGLADERFERPLPKKPKP